MADCNEIFEFIDSQKKYDKYAQGICKYTEYKE